MELSPDLLRKLLAYDPETGVLTWRERPRDMSPSERDWRRWNKRFAGRLAGGVLVQGYLRVGIFARKYAAHRIAWAIHYGEWPADQIDHINGNRSDNRLSNLRAVTNAENARNQKRRADNTSGVMGVQWYKRGGKWQARIGVSGRRRHLGYFDDFEAACAARSQAAREHDFHAGHGREQAPHGIRLPREVSDALDAAIKAAGGEA